MTAWIYHCFAGWMTASLDFVSTGYLFRCSILFSESSRATALQVKARVVNFGWLFSGLDASQNPCRFCLLEEEAAISHLFVCSDATLCKVYVHPLAKRKLR
jgi:hypothetical protein